MKNDSFLPSEESEWTVGGENAAEQAIKKFLTFID